VLSKKADTPKKYDQELDVVFTKGTLHFGPHQNYKGQQGYSNINEK